MIDEIDIQNATYFNLSELPIRNWKFKSFT